MADSKVVQKLDEKLIKEGIIDKAYRDDYKKVHLKLNSLYKKSGAILPEKIFEKGDAVLRIWLNELCKKGASQEKLTSYLRCGLAHLSFDFIESTYKSIDSDDLVTRALLSFKSRDFHKTYYRATDTVIEVKKNRTVKKKAVKKTRNPAAMKKPVKKVKAVKKSSPKKAKSKKPAAKKPVKTVKKKTAKKASKPVKKKPAKAKKTAKKKTLKLKLFKFR